jgi:chitodextrinase
VPDLGAIPAMPFPTDGHGVTGATVPRPGRLRQRTACVVLSALLVLGLFLSLGSLTSRARAAVTAPTLTVSSVTATSAKLTWTASSGAIGYRVYRGLGTAPVTLINTADASVVTYTASALRARSGYTFVVAALGLDNVESRSASRTATTAASTDTTAPTAPSSTSVGATAFSSSRVDVIWGASPSTDVAFYEVLRGGLVVGTVDRPLATKFSDNGLTASTTYSYQVRAVDSAGNRSALTATKSPKTLAPGAVKIVRGPYAVKVTATSAVISWWTNVAVAGSVTFTGRPAVSDAATMQHAVTVTGLTAGTRYSYTVSGGSVTATGSVRTAVPAGTPYTFAVIGDYGAGSSPEQQNADRIAGYNSDFVQTVGDNIYPSAGFPDPSFATQYSDLDGRFFKQFGRVLKTQAFFPANGNHEYYSSNQWWNAFPMPGSNNSWYSYNWGDAHILVLDSMQPYTSGSPQYAFAQADLAGAAATSARWQIVVSPNPPYNTTNSPTGGSSGTRASLVPLFQSHGVDLVLSGDAHNYQRSKPLINGAPVTSGGVTYVVSGGGGNGTNTLTSAMPSFQVTRAAVFESLKVEVSSTALKVTAIAASDGSVVDTFTLGTPDTTAPSAPTNVGGTSTSTSVSLTWTPSTDSLGVHHYNVYRGGTLVASPTGAGYTDSGLAAGTAYTYEVSAVDAAGNESGRSTPAFMISTAPGGGTATAQLLGDATIDPTLTAPPASNTRLKLDASAPQNDLLLKFSVPSTCAVTAAHLKLTVGTGTNDPSSKGGDFYVTSSSDANAGWSEASVAWANAPAKVGSPVTLAGAVVANTTYDVNVTSLVPSAGGTFTIRGSNTSGDGAGYFSKEGSTTAGPQLQLTCG